MRKLFALAILALTLTCAAMTRAQAGDYDDFDPCDYGCDDSGY